MKRMFDENEIKKIASEVGGSVNKLDLVVGEPTVTYDAVTGMTIESTGKLNDEKDITGSNGIMAITNEKVLFADGTDVSISGYALSDVVTTI